jgi:hypothetical protein
MCLLAIDYAHDLALLRLPDGFNRPTLELTSSPLPGEDVWICGFPLHAETPRITRALVSGWECVPAPACCQIAAVVLDGSINPGNSGGPACDGEGKVVGVVCSRRTPFLIPPQALDGVGKVGRKIIDFLVQNLIAHTGIGYALDPADVQKMLDTRAELAGRGPVHEKYSPAVIDVPKRDFLALQAAYVSLDKQPSDTSPIGVFSIDRHGQYYAGWSQSTDRLPITTTDFWRHNAPTIGQGWDGGSFILRGYDVLLYRKQYRGYIVSARFRLVDDT